MDVMRKKMELPEVEPVRLSPIGGIRPGVFILAGLSAAALLLIFALCFLPGLVSGCGWVRFSTNTVNTAVYADGRYIGSSEGSSYRLPAGSYGFDFYVDGAYAGSVEAEVPWRIFLTMFIHCTDRIEFTASRTPEIEEAVSRTFTEGVAKWSRHIGYDGTYHLPPLFSDFAANAIALGFDDASTQLLYGAMHITSKAMHDDFLAAIDMLSSSSVEYRSPELDELMPLLSALYAGEDVRTSGEGGNAVPAPSYSDGFFAYSASTVSMGRNGSASYPECLTAPVEADVDGFEIAKHPVTEYEYALFVEANPYWSRSNIENLIEDGMVDEHYLEGIVLSSSVMSGRPIRSISYNAAQAYCSYLSESTGEEYRLPTEAEWYAASLSAQGKPYASTLVGIDDDKSSPSFMMGQLWEMTSTPIIPLMRLSSYGKAIELGGLYPYDGIIVKGGSYINDPESITNETVGAAERSETSPFIGFRVCRK